MLFHLIISSLNFCLGNDLNIDIVQEFDLKNQFIYNQSNINNSEFIFIVFTDKVTMFTLENKRKLLVNEDIFKVQKFDLLNSIISNLYKFCENLDKKIYVLCDDTKSFNKLFSTSIIEILRNIETLGLHHLYRLEFDRLETSIENVIVSCCLFNILKLCYKIDYETIYKDKSIKKFNPTRQKSKFYENFKRVNVKIFNNFISNVSASSMANSFFGKMGSRGANYKGLQDFISSDSNKNILKRRKFAEVFCDVKIEGKKTENIKHRKLNKLKFFINNDIFSKYLLEKKEYDFSLVNYNNQYICNMLCTIQNEKIFAQMNIDISTYDSNDDYRTKIFKKFLRVNEDDIVNVKENLKFDSNQFDLEKWYKKINNNIDSSDQKRLNDIEFTKFLKFLSSVKESELEMFSLFYFVNDNICRNSFVLKTLKSNTFLSNFIMMMVVRANLFNPYDLYGFDFISKDIQNIQIYDFFQNPSNIGTKLEYLKGTNVYKYFICYIYFKVYFDSSEKHLFLTNIKKILNMEDSVQNFCKGIFDCCKNILKNKTKEDFLFTNSKMLLKKIYPNFDSFDLKQKLRYDFRFIKKINFNKFGEANVRFHQRCMVVF